MNTSVLNDTESNDWRSAYGPGLPWALRRPCGAWFRACGSVESPRQRLLTSASCMPHEIAESRCNPPDRFALAEGDRQVGDAQPSKPARA